MPDIGQLRRSALVSTFAPGAIVDFRDGSAMISGIVAGLEEWDRNFPPAGTLNPQRTNEIRLEQKLRERGINITGFRLPPVLTDADLENHRERLIAVRFPRWQQCPACDRLGPAEIWGAEIGRSALFCQECSNGRKVHVLPVRFVVACDHGHIDDFPWHWWVSHKPDCGNRNGFLVLKSEGAGLARLRLRCPSCKADQNMEGVFTEQTWSGFRCSGRRPWLAGGDQTGCQRRVRAMQRGATNLYFPVTLSSLDIPPWSDALQQHLGIYWHPIISVSDPAQRAVFIRALATSDLGSVLRSLGLSVEQLIEQIERRVALLAQGSNEDLRVEEYRQFAFGSDTSRNDGGQFEIRVEPVLESLAPWIGRVVRAVRLREVRAITCFTRVLPVGDDSSPAQAALSVTQPNWLPAIEVRGEGVFLDLAGAALREWEALPAARARSATVEKLWKAEWQARYGTSPTWMPSPRFLLVHTFAHAVMRQLTLDCGYSSAALRERLYARDEEPGMAGVLVYTATTDADGTLGGLQRQGRPDRMQRIVVAAINAMEWCSSDPLCISGVTAAPETISGAACHACALAPETACEHFNRFLDRALLVGTDDNPEVGFFRGLLIGQH